MSQPSQNQVPAAFARTATTRPPTAGRPARPTEAGRLAGRARRPRHTAVRQGTGRLEVPNLTCRGVDDLSRSTLVATYTFEAAEDAQPSAVDVRFDGRLLGLHQGGHPERFSVTRSIPRVPPGIGRVALTARIPDISEGEWKVAATPLVDGLPLGGDTVRATGRPTNAQLALSAAPRTFLGAWPLLVSLGAAAGLTLAGLLAPAAGVSPGPFVLLSPLACILGILGAKAYYRVTHRDETRGLITTGLSLQGFVITALAVLTAGAALLRQPLGAVLDITAVGLLTGQAIGRLGCFFGGCCVGRPTTSRSGIWSSDRTVGIRRIPVQLLESATALTIAVAATAAILTGADTPAGALAVATLGAYILGRQLLFPLRELPRATRFGRPITLAVSALATATAVVALVT